jgi:hypothetical protein
MWIGVALAIVSVAEGSKSLKMIISYLGSGFWLSAALSKPVGSVDEICFPTPLPSVSKSPKPLPFSSKSVQSDSTDFKDVPEDPRLDARRRLSSENSWTSDSSLTEQLERVG